MNTDMITGTVENPEYTLIEDVGALRNKLLNARPPLDRYWANFCELAARDPIGEFQAFPPLAWLVTGDSKYVPNIRAVMLELLRTLPLAENSIEAQFHCYTACAPIARFAVYLDWIWDSGILTVEERDRLASQMVTQVYSLSCLRLKGRLPSGDNQQVSMAFATTLVGYIFGIKRSNSPAAREMFVAGANRFFSMLKELRPGGWCGEGSVYHVQVMAPILALYTAFMEQITGRDFFRLKVGGSTVEENLKTAGDIINQAGMLPGWDAAGNGPPELKTHLVYYARRSGDTLLLSKIFTHGMWSENTILAWYNDDKVWSLILWPDGQPDVMERRAEPSWINERVGARLIADHAPVEIFQMWDVSGAGLPGRENINPNNVEICAHGTVLTCDGLGKKVDESFFNATVDQMFTPEALASHEASVRGWAAAYGEDVSKVSEEDMKRRARSSAEDLIRATSHCQLKAHSCVIVDNEGYRFMDRETMGVGSDFVDMPSLKAVSGEVTEFYSEIWGLSSMKRSSLLMNDRLILLHDRFSADKPHHYTWQLMLRPDVKVAGNKARQTLVQGNTMDIACPEAQGFSLTPISDFPPGFEQKTHRLAIDQDAQGDGVFTVLLRPDTGRRVIKDISRSWNVRGGGREIPGQLFEGAAACDLSSEYIGPSLEQETVWFGTCTDLNDGEVATIDRITVRKGQFDRLDVHVNGRKAEVVVGSKELKLEGRAWTVHKSSGRSFESQFNVRNLLRPGRNQIAIASSEFRGQVISGPIQLIGIISVPEHELSIEEKNGYCLVRDDGSEWMVTPANNEARALSLPGDLETNAVRVLKGKATLVLAGVTRCTCQDFCLESSQPVSVELSGGKLFVDLGKSEEVTLLMDSGADRLEVRVSAAVSCVGTLPWPVLVKSRVPRAIFLNGALVDLAAPGGQFVELKRQSNEKPALSTTSPFDLGWKAGETASVLEESIRKSLASDNWREQVSAVECAGRNRVRAVVPDLVKLFESEEKKDLYVPINSNWPFSKMMTSFYRWADDSFPEEGKRRFRLKMAILEAVGRMQAREAAPIILRTLEKSSDWYTALVQACIAAARMELKESIPLLEKMTTFGEINARESAKLALKVLKGEMTRLEFENAVAM